MVKLLNPPSTNTYSVVVAGLVPTTIVQLLNPPAPAPAPAPAPLIPPLSAPAPLLASNISDTNPVPVTTQAPISRGVTVNSNTPAAASSGGLLDSFHVSWLMKVLD